MGARVKPGHDGRESIVTVCMSQGADDEFINSTDRRSPRFTKEVADHQRGGRPKNTVMTKRSPSDRRALHR